jgi:hypothetical protein
VDMFWLANYRDRGFPAISIFTSSFFHYVNMAAAP